MNYISSRSSLGKAFLIIYFRDGMGIFLFELEIRAFTTIG
ncbi:hypothetical protein HMPREF9374_3683 [Desmospora sp. 8437]|nr:hypothetical protein HMPREF9374_3683 [Desmospora sp. 8437]